MNDRHFGFARRACPQCRGKDSKILLELTAGEIFRSNWSYRAEHLQFPPFNTAAAFPIVECVVCAFIYALHLPGRDFLDLVYDTVIDQEMARGANFAPNGLARKMGYLQVVLRLLGDENTIRLLDYGCGFGPTLELLRSCRRVESWGYETSSARLRDLQLAGHKVSGTWEQIIQQKPFDVVIMDNVLEHVPFHHKTLARIRSVCSDTALIYISVPHGDATYISAQHRAILEKGLPAMDINPWEHLNYFDLPQLDRMLAQHRFLPLANSQLPGAVDVGLRSTSSALARAKNALASGCRLFKYAVCGDLAGSVNGRFYRTQAS